MAKGRAAVEQAPRNITRLPTSDLLLDAENPRLAGLTTSSGPVQDELLRVLWNEMSVDELVLSIEANGFFPEEPLFVIPAKQKGRYVVVEGNRRLAAVRILTDERARKLVRAGDMPTASAARKRELEALPVSIYESRRELWAYLSFRHINAAKAWDPFSKASYIAQIHEEYGVPLEEIAARIGDRHETVLRMHRGFRVLKEAEEHTAFSAEDRVRSRFFFSHLYTALSYNEFQEFVGITPKTIDKRNPVPAKKYPELEQLMVWLYGSKNAGVEPVVRKQNPDLNRLRVVLKKPQSVALLRQGYSLDSAFDSAVGDARRLSESLTKAKAEMQKAKATVTTGYKGELDLLGLASDIQELATTIVAEMKQKNARVG